MKHVYKILCVSLILNGCAGFVQDAFVGDIPTSRELWSRADTSDTVKLNDSSTCTKNAEAKFPIEKNLDHFLLIYDNCMLDKGYEFHPRGLNGDKASACQFSRPACQ